MTRLDTPALAPSCPPFYTAAAIAYAGVRGISAVELSADSGASWLTATFLSPNWLDSWIRWQSSFTISAGQHHAR